MRFNWIVRLKNPAVWLQMAAVAAAQVLALLVTLGVIDTGLSESINAVITSLLQLLVTFGVLNNPTSKGTF